jgi:hypothetical protein
MTLDSLREEAWEDVNFSVRSLYESYTDHEYRVWPSLGHYNDAVSKIRANYENTLNNPVRQDVS